MSLNNCKTHPRRTVWSTAIKFGMKSYHGMIGVSHAPFQIPTHQRDVTEFCKVTTPGEE